MNCIQNQSSIIKVGGVLIAPLAKDEKLALF